MERAVVKTDGAGAPMKFEKLSLDSIPMLLEIQEEAFEVLPSPELLRRNTYETLAVCFNRDSLVLGAYVGEEIAGFGILYAAGRDEENLAYSLDGCENPECYANAKLVIVRPRFRGLGIQRLLIDRMVDFAKNKGFWGVCATVSPKNNYSAANLSRCGFEQVKTLVKYGGLTRILWFKSLRKSEA